MKSWANLDLLRAFAVLIVVAAHAKLYTRSGHQIGWLGLSGVCLFFVHTSLVLMWSMEREPDVLHFYLRRFFRLYPLWLVVLALVLLFRMPIAPPAAPNFAFLRPGIREVLANASLTMNFFPGGARIVGASWSLPIEVQMYVLLPFLFYFLRSTRAIWVLLLVDALAFVSVWAAMPWSSDSVNLAIAIPYFLPGVMAYALSKRVRPILPSWLFPLALLAYVTLHMRYGSLPASAGFCLAVGLSLPFFKQVTWQPLCRGAHYIAKYSYGIYLCHIPAICVGVEYLRHYSVAVRICGGVAVAVLGPVLLYHTVEEPMIECGKRVTRKAKAPIHLTEVDLELEPAP